MRYIRLKRTLLHTLGISFPLRTSRHVSAGPRWATLANCVVAVAYLTSSGAASLSSQPSVNTGSFASDGGRRNVSGFKIMTVTRGFTEEADKLLDYMVYALPSVPSTDKRSTDLGEWYLRRAAKAVPS